MDGESPRLVEDGLPTAAGFKKFQRVTFVLLGACLAAIVLVALVTADRQSTWVNMLRLFGLVVAFSMFPGFTSLRLACGSYARFLERYPAALAKERDRERRRRSPTTLHIVAKVLLVLFLGSIAAFFLWISWGSGDPGMLFIGMAFAALPVAVLWVVLTAKSASRLPRPK